MGWFKHKTDPISARAQALQEEICQLEAQIRELSTRTDGAPAGISTLPSTPESPAAAATEHSPPRLRSTALPRGPTLARPNGVPARPHPEQVFERVDHRRLQAPPETVAKTLYNELGVRKYDLPGAWQRFRDHFHGPHPENQTLVKLLAAGNIQGPRSLRYEKRVARRRFIIFVAVLFLVLWGIIAMFLSH